MGLGLVAALDPAAPAGVRLVALDVEEGLVELAPMLLELPLLDDALVSMNDDVPVALAPAPDVRDVPVVACVDEVLAPLVPVTPA